MISHYATGGPGQHLLPGLEEATSDDKSPVLVFILTVNNDWSQVYPSEEPGDNCLTSGQGLTCMGPANNDQSLCYVGEDFSLQP